VCIRHHSRTFEGLEVGQGLGVATSLHAQYNWSLDPQKSSLQWETPRNLSKCSTGSQGPDTTGEVGEQSVVGEQSAGHCSSKWEVL